MRSFSEWYLNHNVSTFLPPHLRSNKGQAIYVNTPLGGLVCQDCGITIYRLRPPSSHRAAAALFPRPAVGPDLPHMAQGASPPDLLSAAIGESSGVRSPFSPSHTEKQRGAVNGIILTSPIKERLPQTGYSVVTAGLERGRSDNMQFSTLHKGMKKLTSFTKFDKTGPVFMRKVPYTYLKAINSNAKI